MLEFVTIVMGLYVIYLGYQDLTKDRLIQHLQFNDNSNYNSILKLEKDMTMKKEKSTKAGTKAKTMFDSTKLKNAKTAKKQIVATTHTKAGKRGK